ncbi:MAG: hypothetical protein ACT4P5_16250 [Armatimonadota bacterium]
MHHDLNPWKGFTLGIVGGVAGLFAMAWYWQTAASLSDGDPRKWKGRATSHALDSISFVGKQHEDGESASAAVGRMAYELLTGKKPRSKETRETLSNLVHWVVGMALGGAYGAVRGRTSEPDGAGGLTFGTAVWLVGDELALPIFGLAKGPTAYAPALHAHGFGAHVAYGLATSTVTQLLRRLI